MHTLLYLVLPSHPQCLAKQSFITKHLDYRGIRSQISTSNKGIDVHIYETGSDHNQQALLQITTKKYLRFQHHVDSG